MSRLPRVGAAAVALLALALAVGLVAGGAGSATAGDNVAHVEFEPAEVDVEPGDTVEVDVSLSSYGEYGDTGVSRVTLRVDYPTEYLTVTDVVAGDWFHEAPDGDPDGASQESVDVSESVAVDDDAGAARVRQTLSDPTSGVIGSARVATFTVEVAADADAATAEFDPAESEVMLTSQYPQPLAAPPAEVHVDGGGDVVQPAYAEDAFADDGSTATPESTAESTAESTGTAGDAGDDSAADGDAAPDGATDDGVPTPTGAVALGVLVAALLFRRR